MSDATRAQAWRVALAGLLALAVAMGIGRFAFTPLLPMMLRDAELTLAGGAALASANYLGYFIGALLCMRWRVEAATTMRAGLVATVLLTLAMGAHSVVAALGESAPEAASLMPLWTLLRGLAGVASAGVFVFTSGWCLQRLAQLGHVQLGNARLAAFDLRRQPAGWLRANAAGLRAQVAAQRAWARRCPAFMA